VLSEAYELPKVVKEHETRCHHNPNYVTSFGYGACKYYQILENLPFGHKQTFEKTQLKIFFKKLLFLGDMDDYIKLINVPKR